MGDRTSLRRQIANGIIRGGIVALIAAIAAAFLLVMPLRRQKITQAENTQDAVINHFDNVFSYNDGFMNSIAALVEQSETVEEYVKDPSERNALSLSIMLNNAVSYIRVAQGVALIGEDVPYVTSMTNLTEEDRAILEEAGAQVETYGRGYTSVYETQRSSHTYRAVAYGRNYYINGRWWKIVLFFNLDSMISNIRLLVRNDIDAFTMYDSTGKAFFSSGPEKYIPLTAGVDLEEGIDNYDYVKGNLMLYNRSSVCGFGIVSCVSNGTLARTLVMYLIEAFALLAGLILLNLFMVSRAVNEVMEPINELTGRMLSAAEGDLDCAITVNRFDEVGQLQRSFNKMISDLKTSMESERVKEEQRQQAMYSLMVSQMDPHFIYNTMNSINYLARKGRDEDIITVNTALLTVLRDRLRVDGIDNTEKVEHEIQVIKEYLKIENFMYDGDLKVVWDVQPEVLQKQMPKDMIQPLVENALFHGLMNEETGTLYGTITIRLRLDETGSVVLRVEDDGAGMEKEKLREVNGEEFNPAERGKRVGLANVRGRLYYLYPGKECLQVESTPGRGTCVTIRFPEK